MQDLDVYEKLYDITNANKMEVESKLSFGKNAFLSTIGLSPSSISVLDLADLNNDDFFQGAFMGLIRRVAGPKTVGDWKSKIENYNQDEFRKLVINSLMKAEEFTFGGIIVHDNIYSENELKQQVVISKMDEMPNKYMIKIIKIYRRLPLFIKKVARFIVNRIG